MRKAPELVAAVLVVLTFGALRVLAVTAAAGEPGGGVGHALGVAGFVLMLVAQIAYTVRKRSTDRAWGPLQTWMRVHVFSGIVGPALVVMHAPPSWATLGGWASFATLVVALSGLAGRLLFSALPREGEGSTTTSLRTLRRAAAARRGLAVWYVLHVPLSLALFVLVLAHVGAALYYSIGTR